MLNNYEINNSTLAIVPINAMTSEVVEEDRSFLINKPTTKIIDDSCKYFGSSYDGRHEGTKNLIGVNYKSPIIIEESQEIIFFPTKSPRFDNCFWISLKNIENYTKNQQNSIILFKNGKQITVDISYASLENQILRATRLESILRKRKNI